MRGHPQFRSRKQQRTEAVEIQKAPKCAKKPKDPNQPKKPHTAFFVFMEEFRKKYREDNADAKGVNRQGADKWKSMTEEDKKPYFKKAHTLKMEYEIAMAKYLEQIRQANEEADSAEVGIIDTAAEYSYEDYLYELEDSSYYTSDDYASEY